MANQFTKNLLKFAVCLFGLMCSKCVAQRFTSTEDAEAFEHAFENDEKEFYEPSADLNDDELHSPYMPEYFECDACHILTYKFNRRFDFENEKRPSLNKKLPVTDILEAVEEVCSNEFAEIGVKELDGVKRLSGPGSSAYFAGGVMHGGGLWPLRMQIMCGGLTGEYEEIYKAYRGDELRMYLCDDPETGYCKNTNIEQLRVEPQTRQAGIHDSDKLMTNIMFNGFEDILHKLEEGTTIENEQVEKEEEGNDGIEGRVIEELIVKKEEL